MRRSQLCIVRATSVAAVLTFATPACGSGEATTATSTSDSSSTAASTNTSSEVDTTDAVNSAQWGDNVTVTIGDNGTFRFESNGIPNHELPDQFLIPQGQPGEVGADGNPVTVATATADVVTETPLDVTIPLNPVYSEQATDTNLGQIGVVISGAQLFNDYEDMQRTLVAVDDNFAVSGVDFIDSCNGHPLAAGGDYHYHGVPYCITDRLDVAGQHSKVLAFALDGFPVYGPQNEDGVSATNETLDECSGEFGPTPEFPDGIYHYHLTDDKAPYSLDCLHGEVDMAAQGAGEAGGAAPNLDDAAAKLGVTVTELEDALGSPPFDLAAAAKTLGISQSDLEAALPAPPNN
jgi:YHYH protein